MAEQNKDVTTREVLLSHVKRSRILGRLRYLSMNQSEVILCGLCVAFSADTMQ